MKDLLRSFALRHGIKFVRCMFLLFLRVQIDYANYYTSHVPKTINTYIYIYIKLKLRTSGLRRSKKSRTVSEKRGQ